MGKPRCLVNAASLSERDFNYHIYVDGSCIPNPGVMGLGVWSPTSGLELIGLCGHGTSPLAEWLALEAALKHVQVSVQIGWSVCIKTDSKLVVKQANCEWAVKSSRITAVALRCFERLHAMSSRKIAIRWVNRQMNWYADALAKQGASGLLPQNAVPAVPSS